MRFAFLFFFIALLFSCENNSDTTPKVNLESSFIASNYENFNYYFYTPKNPNNNIPLIVYLHGGSGKGDDLEKLVSTDGFPKYLKDGQINLNTYVAIPQLSSDYKSWNDIKSKIIELITMLKQEHSINTEKISLTGHSMGGTGTWQVALEYPNFFYKIAPMSGSIDSTKINLEKLKNLPIWTVVGSADTIVDPSVSINFIDAISSKNPNAKITILENYDHFKVPEFYLDKEQNILEWLISE